MSTLSIGCAKIRLASATGQDQDADRSISNVATAVATARASTQQQQQRQQKYCARKHMTASKRNDGWHPMYRPDIDGLRAVAILSVLAYHADPSWLRGGFCGVDLFFVISGYLITQIISNQLESGLFRFRDFYFRRIARIFPALLVVLFACYVVGWWNLIDVEYKELGKEIAAAAGFVANLVLWGEVGYFDVDARTKPLLQLWSLGIEEQFYFFWPFALWWAHRARWKASHVSLGIGLGSFAANLWAFQHSPTADFYSPFTRFWELMAGGWLALRHHESEPPTASNDRWAALGAALILSSLLLLRHRTFPGWQAIFPVLGAALLIGAGPQSWPNRRVLAHPALVGIGLISFSLYLWHWPLLVFANDIEGSWPRGLVLAGLFAVSGILAWLTYRFVETPMRRPMWRRRVVACSAAAMVVAGFLGYKTDTRNGLAFRLDAMAEKFVAVQDANQTIAQWREDTCFLEYAGQRFAPRCVEPGNLPLVFLWGDSHAAQLYPGLRSLRTSYRFRIAQYTTTGCPPLVDGDNPRPLCRNDNAAAITAIARLQPKLVLLSANWTANDLSRLSETIRTLHAIGIQRIAIIGPTPIWNQLLSKLYFRYWRLHHRVLPRQSRFGLVAGPRMIDTTTRQIAKHLKLLYLSPFDVLCNAGGCATRVGHGRGIITTFDNSHLTLAASNELMQQFGPELFSAIRHSAPSSANHLVQHPPRMKIPQPRPPAP